MKKILCLFFGIFIFSIKVYAINDIPKNIYYFDENLNAYLEIENIKDLLPNEESKIYIEYRLLDSNENEKILDKIEINENKNPILLLEKDDEFLNVGIENIRIDARFITYDTKYNYLEWSSKENINVFNFENAPTPIISELNITSDSKYTLENKSDILNYFNIYKKIFNVDIEYIEEFQINDGKWQSSIDNVDFEDVKINFRVKYKIKDFESNYSNTLNYEKHPEKQMCVFDSELCCNTIFSISICIWIFIISLLLITILIIIDRKRRLNREA